MESIENSKLRREGELAGGQLFLIYRLPSLWSAIGVDACNGSVTGGGAL
jgi:hypothetical protein